MARPRRSKAVRGRRGTSAARAAVSGPADLVTYLAKGLVDDSTGVSVRDNAHENGHVLELRVALNDLGKVIGKSGRTAQAMRSLLALCEDGENAVLEIKD